MLSVIVKTIQLNCLSFYRRISNILKPAVDRLEESHSINVFQHVNTPEWLFLFPNIKLLSF